jgi:transmembrane sensor
VKLLAGQAFFSVRHDGRRPFSVEADDVDVTVTGTEFDVRLAPRDVSVAVAEGEVHVTYPGEGERRARAGAAVLAAGEGLRIRRPDGAAERMPAPPQSIASWRRGRLLIESATIGDLVAELRRYRSGMIVVTDDALARQRVTGVFDLTDPVRALKTVVEPHAGRVREITPWLVIVSGG